MRESALYLHRRIGQWTAEDARLLLGNPISERTAIGEDDSPSGRIFAYRDPSGRYREIELDFDAGDGRLRTVFVYPFALTWQDCQRRWSGEVSATEAKKGRIFYSYQNRRLDVLVDPGGKVISLGLY